MVDMKKHIRIKRTNERRPAVGQYHSFVRKVDAIDIREVDIRRMLGDVPYEQGYDVTFCYKIVTFVPEDAMPDAVVRIAAKEMKRYLYGEIAKELRDIAEELKQADEVSIHAARELAMRITDIVVELEK